MRKLFLLIVPTLISTVVYANEDSLIARIGNKAKIIFYADKHENLKEIEKYDLNLLFKELKKRSEKNFLLNEDITLKDADELKNRETNSPKSNRWLRSMSLNIFTGISTTETSGMMSVQQNDLLIATIGKVGFSKNYSLRSKSTFMFGIGGFWDKSLIKRNKFDFGLKYGAGLDFINSKVYLTQNHSFTNLPPSFDITLLGKPGIIIDPNPTILPEPKNILSSNLYIQMIPTISLINSRGEKTFNFGIGIKTALSLNNITGQQIPPYQFKGDNIPSFSFKYRTLQTALVANIGYKYINLFAQVQPNIATIRAYKPMEAGKPISSIQGNASTYIVGLRLGK